MTIKLEEISHWACLLLKEKDKYNYKNYFNKFINMIYYMNKLYTKDIIPMLHPLEATQILRSDKVTEYNKEKICKSCAPIIIDDLYLIHKFLE
ncbi:Glutamyl-tRNA(Gln) amidotransferase subunit C [Candidatus Johnevansia muelleri]|uniref:Glutamyl-tRNA(Gln) amidotransferase subunit C n=1 Tax=Candidatus Johnevansia muelleri TaxID=1495769 RepID=A0A078KII0_9GAMM|nr:Glutamyl-tRNA(Gln) amidotransferase subunit C [Candidatus Evansia muelleri]